MTDPALRQLLDTTACADLLARYGQAVDHLDRTALERLFWPDAKVDLGFFKGNGSQAADFLIANGHLSLRRSHVTCNSVFDFASDAVVADSCAITHAISADDSGGMVRHVFLGRYRDRFVQREGEWRFAARRYELHDYTAAAYAEDPALTAMSTNKTTGEWA